MSSSSMIVILVLPFEGMTAPRRPLLKSYSLRMVLLHFALAGLPCRDEANSIAPVCVDNDQYSPQCIHSEGYEALLAFRVGVVNGHGERIPKRLFGVRKAD